MNKPRIVSLSCFNFKKYQVLFAGFGYFVIKSCPRKFSLKVEVHVTNLSDNRQKADGWE